ncbi:MAG: RsmD family RNA methyltransferase [Planctomycetes bacterium]|nr:RsmD family RNA methyltransferase [Planctomycetota bacterium]
MRILTGKYKGLEIPSDLSDKTRPLTTLLRRSIFDSFGRNLEGKVVYDLFAGSGSFGLEAISNGALQSVFVDISGKNCDNIRKFLQSIQAENGTVLNCSYERISERVVHEFPPDIVFADPPYALARNKLLAGSIYDGIVNAFKGNSFILIYRLFSKVELLKKASKVVKHGQDSVYFICVGSSSL